MSRKQGPRGAGMRPAANSVGRRPDGGQNMNALKEAAKWPTYSK